MIKMVGVGKDGMPLVVLGLSGENVTRLVAGEPILVDLAELLASWKPALDPDQPWKVNVALTYGRTEEDILAEASRHVPVRVAPPPGG